MHQLEVLLRLSAFWRLTGFIGGYNMHVMSINLMIHLLVLREKGHFRYYTFGIGIWSLRLTFIPQGYVFISFFPTALYNLYSNRTTWHFPLYVLTGMLMKRCYFWRYFCIFIYLKKNLFLEFTSVTEIWCFFVIYSQFNDSFKFLLLTSILFWTLLLFFTCFLGHWNVWTSKLEWSGRTCWN